jgi:hypothetical protein
MAGRKVAGMNRQSTTGNDRRAVPRHIRDAEHDLSRDLPADPESAGRRPAVFFYALAGLALAAAAAWYLTTRP